MKSGWTGGNCILLPRISLKSLLLVHECPNCFLFGALFGNVFLFSCQQSTFGLWRLFLFFFSRRIQIPVGWALFISESSQVSWPTEWILSFCCRELENGLLWYHILALNIYPFSGILAWTGLGSVLGATLLFSLYFTLMILFLLSLCFSSYAY